MQHSTAGDMDPSSTFPENHLGDTNSEKLIIDYEPSTVPANPNHHTSAESTPLP